MEIVNYLELLGAFFAGALIFIILWKIIVWGTNRQFGEILK